MQKIYENDDGGLLIYQAKEESELREIWSMAKTRDLYSAVYLSDFNKLQTHSVYGMKKGDKLIGFAMWETKHVNNFDRPIMINDTIYLENEYDEKFYGALLFQISGRDADPIKIPDVPVIYDDFNKPFETNRLAVRGRNIPRTDNIIKSLGLLDVIRLPA